MHNEPSCIKCARKKVIFLKIKGNYQSFSQFSRSVMSDYLQPHGLQHARLPVHHQLLEITQTHVHSVGDVIQSSRPLSSPSPFTFNLSQHQGLFQWFGSSYQVAKYWTFSFSISPSNKYSGLIPLGLTAWISLQSKGLPRVFSNTTVQKHQFFSAQFSFSECWAELSWVMKPYLK